PPPGVTRATGGRPAVEPGRLDIGRGARVTAEDVAHWVPARSLVSGAEVLVPAAAVRPAGPYNPGGRRGATPPGTRARPTVAHALGAGLASALAFHALDRAVRGGAVATVDPSAFGSDPELDFLNRSASNLELAFEVLDLGEDRVSGVHAMVARAGVGDHE